MRHHAADDRTVEESGGDARTMRGYRGIEGKPLGKILNVALAMTACSSKGAFVIPVSAHRAV
jgi:hypothetical protein